MRPSLATDRISLGFWLNIKFVVNYRGAFRSIVAIAIDLLTSEDRYFLWITAVPLPRRCLQSRQYSVSRMRGVTLAQSGPSNLRPESDHRYWILLLFRQPITSPICALYWSLGRRGYFGVSNVVLVQMYGISSAWNAYAQNTITSSIGNIFRATGLLGEEFAGHRWIPHKDQWGGAFMFSLICAWIKGWVNNRYAGHLRSPLLSNCNVYHL